MKKTILKTALTLSFTFISLIMLAQGNISGRVVEAETNQPIPGVSVIEKGTTNGVTTNVDGYFTLRVNNDATILLSYIGYTTKSLKYLASENNKDFGTIPLKIDAQNLGEVVVIGSGIIDLAADRKTPIAVTNIKASVIEEKVGTSDLPELLKSTPSVQSIQKGGFGDGQMYLRGFDQTNTAFLLNGQPINGMEDGRMYWSNWSGVLDIANAVQVQRGLGSSKLAISSVGGTVNIVTKTVDRQKGGFVKAMTGNDAYAKGAAYYSTGLMENGLAVAAMFGHWQGDGYMEGAKGQGQTYFLSFGYKPNDNHIFNFLLTGAPQWHGASGGMTLSTYLDKGRKYSDWWGYKDGDEYAGGRNYYHKPILNLSWDWNINEKATLSSVAYGSYGRGGFAYPEGDYSQPRDKQFYAFRDEDGYLDYDAIEAHNKSVGASNFVKASVNAHNWYGLVTNLEYLINENIKFNLGVDGRFYNGLHYRTAADLLGGTKDVNNKYNGSYTITEETGFNPWENTFKSVDRKQRYGYDYEENINYIGAFGQVEYSTEIYSAFFQGAISNQSHLKTDYWNYEKAEESDKVNNLGFNIKGGASFNINENNIIFGNVGFYSRQPFHDDIFTNIRKSNELSKFGDENQEITGFELGYKFKSDYISVNLNGYHTIWDNRILSSAKDTNNDGASDIFTKSSGIKEIHQGIELDVFTRPLLNLNLDGFISIGDWKYSGDVETRSYDKDDKLISTGEKAYIDGVKIGNASQFTAGIQAKYRILQNFSIDATFNYFDNLYSSIDLSSEEYKNKDNRGALELPSYNTLDAGLTYVQPIYSTNSLMFRLNVNNIFDEFYIENSKTNIFAESGDETWNGINKSNKVYIGYGRTWNVSVIFKF